MPDRVLEFLCASGISAEYAPEMGCQVISTNEISAICGIPSAMLQTEGGIWIPYRGVTTPDGSQYGRVRTDGPRKYVGFCGCDPEVYVPPRYEKHLPQRIEYIVEGEKKAAAMDCLGLRAVAVSGVHAWADAGYRAQEKLNGGKLSSDTRPHSTLLRGAKTANRIIVVGDSDLRTNPIARAGFIGLLGALDRYANEALDERRTAEDWNPITENRVLLVALAVLHPNPRSEPNHQAKVGIDDLIVRLLEEFDGDRDRVRAEVVRYLDALAIGSMQATDRALGRQVAIANQRTLAYRNKTWLSYRTDGTWEETKSGRELDAPPRIANDYQIAGSILSGKRIEVIGAYADIPRQDWPTDLKRFAAEAETEIKAIRAAEKRLTATRSQRDILAQTASKVEIPPRLWDRRDHTLATPQGLIDLRTGKLSQHDPANLITCRIKTNYDPLAQCPQWEAWMTKVLPDPEVRSYFQAVIGYCATGSAVTQEMYFWVGSGKNGKGTTKEVLRHVFGPYAVTGAKTLLMKHPNGEPHPTDLATIDNKRWVTLSELDDGMQFDGGALKRLTGDKDQTARKMHQDFYDFEMKGALTIDTNDIPHITECSPAMQRRIIVIEWPYRAPDDEFDTMLVTRLKSEACGILNWVLAGARMFYDGALHPSRRPAAVQAAIAKLWRNFDTLQQWIDTECVTHPNAETDIAVLREAYKAWCIQQDFPAPKHHAVAKKLRLKSDKFPSRESSGKTLYAGIRLKTEAERQMQDCDDLEEPERQPVQHKPPVIETENHPAAAAPAPARQRRLLQ